MERKPELPLTEADIRIKPDSENVGLPKPAKITGDADPLQLSVYTGDMTSRDSTEATRAIS